MVLLLRCFNPRPREGGDQAGGIVAGVGIVSIHAPAKGATVVMQEGCNALTFQSTPPRRGRRFCCNALRINGASFVFRDPASTKPFRSALNYTKMI